MNKNLIIRTLEDTCQGKNLIFQILEEESILYVYINREAENNLDYENLQERIYTALTELNIPNLLGIALYSRERGQYDPDWESYRALSALSSIQTELIDLDRQAEISLDEEAELELSKYCFIRNHLLLTSELVSPSLEVCKIVAFVHNLSELEKQQILSRLESYFKSKQRPSGEQFSEKIKNGLTSIIELAEKNERQLSIWLSRYCFNPTETMFIVQKVFDFEAKKAAAKQTAACAAKQAAKQTAQAAAKQAVRERQSKFLEKIITFLIPVIIFLLIPAPVKGIVVSIFLSLLLSLLLSFLIAIFIILIVFTRRRTDGESYGGGSGGSYGGGDCGGGGGG